MRCISRSSNSRAPRRRLALLAALAMLAMLVVAGRAAAGVEDDGSAVLLVAKPDMRDPGFAQTVVLVTFPQDAGPMGVILNRPAGIAIGDLLAERTDVRPRRDPVHFGGPLEPDGLLFVFHAPLHPVKALPILDDLYLSGDGTIFNALMAATGNAVNQRFYVGHSGWDEGQLDAEIASGAWFVLPADPAVIFDMAPEHMWETLVARAQLPSTNLYQPRHVARIAP